MMELKNRLDLLIQSAKLAQKNGILTLDDAVIVKSAIENIEKNTNVKESVDILVKLAQVSQSKGVFTLKDAFYIYMAIDGIEKELNAISDVPENKGNDVVPNENTSNGKKKKKGED